MMPRKKARGVIGKYNGQPQAFCCRERTNAMHMNEIEVVLALQFFQVTMQSEIIKGL
jgi:hypothetical protein